MLLAGDGEVTPSRSLHDDINFHSSTKGLKLFHLNIRSLHAKFDEVRDILLSCKKVDIFGFTETFLTDIDTTSYVIPSFTSITRNLTSGSGWGVCVYVRGINFELREDLYCDYVEGFFIEILSKKSKHFIVAFMYKPPETSKHLSRNFDQILFEKIQTITKEKKKRDLNVSYNKIDHQKVIKKYFIR